MHSYDVKKVLPQLYAPKPGDWHVVEVPELLFLMVDGHGDPDASPAYAEAVEALFTLSYAVRAVAKDDLGLVHTVGPLEGLWRADDPRVFVAGDKSAWDWTMMVWQPSWATPDIVESAVRRAARRSRAAPVLARLHDDYLPQHGLTFNGDHHEIYLSDARRTEPAKLRTVLRQPIGPS